MLKLLKRSKKDKVALKRKQCRECYKTFWNTKDIKIPTTIGGRILFGLGFENLSNGEPIKTKTFKACPYCYSVKFIEV